MFLRGVNPFREAPPTSTIELVPDAPLSPVRGKFSFDLPSSLLSPSFLDLPTENHKKDDLPSVTSSSLNVARFIGKYIAIMRDLGPLALDAIKGLQELFDFYLYASFMMFGISASRFFTSDFDPKLYPTLRRSVLSVKNQVESGEFGGGCSQI